MIFLSHIFHISNGTSFLTGIRRQNFDFTFPCFFDLYVNNLFVRKLKIEGMILDNGYTIDAFFGKITLWMEGHPEQELINDQIDACLRYAGH